MAEGLDPPPRVQLAHGPPRQAVRQIPCRWLACCSESARPVLRSHGAHLQRLERRNPRARRTWRDDTTGKENEELHPIEYGEDDRCLPRQLLPKRARITGIGEASFKINQSVLHQLRNLTVEMLHPLGRAGFDGVENTLILALPFFDALASTGIRFKDFESGNPAAAIRLRHPPLADDVAKRFGKTFAHRLLLSGQERTDNPLHRLRSVHRIQTGEHEMT